MGYCGCGCGATVKRRFLLGHASRLRPKSLFLKDCGCGCGRQTNYTYARGHRPSLVRDKEGRKLCPTCKEWKPLTVEYFPRSGMNRKFGANCKPCHVRVGTRNEKARLIRDPEYLMKRRKEWAAYRRKRRIVRPGLDAEIKRRTEQKLRSAMVQAYGGACSCCRETELQFLTLEHIKGDGKLHRALVGEGAPVWRDLKRQGWPKDGFTILCWNCHMSTRNGRACPHKGLNRSAITVDLT